jgi:DNA-nicking Smr family endonuclease
VLIEADAVMNDDEIQLFEREMADVQPLRSREPRVLRGSPETTPGQLYRREAAQRPLSKDENFLTTGFVEFVHPQAILSFKRPGIQDRVFSKLRQGIYPIDATLDLHLLSVEAARCEVYSFIRDCLRHEVRTALIHHGKGGRGRENQCSVKSYIARWLPMFSEIMAFHSAQGFHGGTGAVYVMLRKSEKQKEQTRERFGLSSGKPVA